jgi:hypothetical protein
MSAKTFLKLRGAIFVPEAKILTIRKTIAFNEKLGTAVFVESKVRRISQNSP